MLAWYDRAARDLPWRRTKDPFAIWISEVMLQQTRVETVRDRWEPFLSSFPDVQQLAAAPVATVLKAWEGLGYYGRARRLREAARLVVRDHAGKLPADEAMLRSLPGFGAYTSAAVASIAFGRRHAVVDGNVVRVLARWLGENGDVTRRAALRNIEAAASALIPRGRPGDWNQAVMELGALLCAPRRPNCEACPLRLDCVARAEGTAETLPTRPSRRKTPHYDIAAGLVWRGRRLLIARRPADGLLGGLWEFPGGKRGAEETLEAACVREIKEETGLDVEVVAPFLAIDHAYSHFRITLHLFHCRAGRGRPQALGCESPRFVTVRDLEHHAFPRANRRAIEALHEDLGGEPPDAV